MASNQAREPVHAAVQVRDVVRRYGSAVALNGLTFTAPERCIFGLLGPNGSGKSTLLSLLAGGEPPDAGSVEIFGRATGGATRQQTGMVFQEGTLDPLATIGENLELSGRLFGLARRECRERGASLLAGFGLADQYDAAIQTLSGGMRRRVEIARALLHQPRLLLMDEATTGVDVEERAAVWNHLRTFVGQGGSVVLATNDLIEAERVCTEAVFLKDGRVVGQGTPDSLKAGLRRETIIVDWSGDPVEGTQMLHRVPGVESADAEGTVIQLSVDDANAVAPRLFAAVGRGIVGLRIRPASLEDAYFQHVAREPRQPEAHGRTTNQ